MTAVRAAMAFASLAASMALALVVSGSSFSSWNTALLQIVRPYSLAGEVVYERSYKPRLARMSFLPLAALEMEYPPASYNNHKLREAGCFGFDRNPGPPTNYENWTPDDHATWCQTVAADGDAEGETRIGDPRLRGDPELRVGNLIGEGNALIDINEYADEDASMGEAQREVVDRTR